MSNVAAAIPFMCQMQNFCIFIVDEVETTDHLFFLCPIASDVWALLLNASGPETPYKICNSIRFGSRTLS